MNGLSRIRNVEVESFIVKRSAHTRPSYPTRSQTEKPIRLQDLFHLSGTNSTGGDAVHSFQKFDLEAHSRCAHDRVSIYDGQAINSSQMIARYCGRRIPPDVVSSGSSVVVNFVTDHSVSGEGFFATYRSVYGKPSSSSYHHHHHHHPDSRLFNSHKPELSLLQSVCFSVFAG